MYSPSIGSFGVISVSTDPAPAPVSLPLPGEAATVALVVVVVGRVVEAVPPHGRPGGRLYQAAMAPAQPGVEEEEAPEEYEEHLATVCSLCCVVYSVLAVYLQVSFPCNSLITIHFIFLKMYSSAKFC